MHRHSHLFTAKGLNFHLDFVQFAHCRHIRLWHRHHRLDLIYGDDLGQSSRHQSAAHQADFRVQAVDQSSHWRGDLTARELQLGIVQGRLGLPDLVLLLLQIGLRGNAFAAQIFIPGQIGLGQLVGRLRRGQGYLVVFGIYLGDYLAFLHRITFFDQHVLNAAADLGHELEAVPRLDRAGQADFVAQHAGLELERDHIDRRGLGLSSGFQLGGNLLLFRRNLLTDKEDSSGHQQNDDQARQAAEKKPDDLAPDGFRFRMMMRHGWFDEDFCGCSPLKA